MMQSRSSCVIACSCGHRTDSDDPFFFDGLADAYEDAAARNVIARGMKRFEAKKYAPPQPSFEILSPRVAAVLAHNPGQYTLNGTMCYLVGTGPRRILVDAGEEDFGTQKFLDGLRRCMSAVGCVGIEKILLTHLHGDHFGNVGALQKIYGPGIPVGIYPVGPNRFYTMRELEKRGLIPYLERGPKPFGGNRDSVSSSDLPEWPDEDLSWDKFKRSKAEIQRSFWFIRRHDEFHKKLTGGEYPHIALAEGMVLRTEGATLRVVHTPGHASEHCAFLVEEDNDLLSGDTVLGFGTTFFRNLYDYMHSLQKMLSLRPGRLLPGHGPIIENGQDYIQRYIAHRQGREDQIVSALAMQGRAVSAMELAELLYVDTPRRKLYMAAENVDRVLVKLLQERRATAWRLVSGELQRADDEVDTGYDAAPPSPDDGILWRSEGVAPPRL